MCEEFAGTCGKTRGRIYAARRENRARDTNNVKALARRDRSYRSAISSGAIARIPINEGDFSRVTKKKREGRRKREKGGNGVTNGAKPIREWLLSARARESPDVSATAAVPSWLQLLCMRSRVRGRVLASPFRAALLKYSSTYRRPASRIAGFTSARVKRSFCHLRRVLTPRVSPRASERLSKARHLDSINVTISSDDAINCAVHPPRARGAQVTTVRVGNSTKSSPDTADSNQHARISPNVLAFSTIG